MNRLPDANHLASYACRTLPCRQFADYYMRMQAEGGTLIPRRSAFKPAAAKAFLPHISIYEVVGERQVNARLIGTSVTTRTKMNITGKNLLETLPPQARDWSWAYIQHILHTPCGGTFLSREHYEHYASSVEIMHLPFLNANGNPTVFLSVTCEVELNDRAVLSAVPRSLRSAEEVRYIDLGGGIGEITSELAAGW